MKNIFKNPEFEKLFDLVIKETQDYIDKHKIKLEENITVDDLIMWQRPQSGQYLVYPTEKCSEELKPAIIKIITKYNPTIKK